MPAVMMPIQPVCWGRLRFWRPIATALEEKYGLFFSPLRKLERGPLILSRQEAWRGQRESLAYILHLIYLLEPLG